MKCEYTHCRHKGNLNCNDYNGHWFHKDCYKERQNLIYMLDLWKKHINKRVNPGDFYKHTYALFDKHPSDYIVFCLEYAIDNHKGLNYPAGLKFYVDKQEFKEAYVAAKEQAARKKAKQFKFEVKESQEEVKPTFTPQVDNGFSAILGK